MWWIFWNFFNSSLDSVAWDFFFSKMAKIRHQKNQWLPLMQHHPQKKGLTFRLEHPQQYSLCDPAHYNWMKRNQNIPAWLSKMLWPSIFAKFLEASKGTEKICDLPPEKSVIIMIWLLLPVANHNDWSRWFGISNLPPICALATNQEVKRKHLE
jgi:hypothetical protein